MRRVRIRGRFEELDVHRKEYASLLLPMATIDLYPGSALAARL